MEHTFQIYYKLRLGEAEDTGYEYIKSSSEEDALKKFAKMNKIKTAKFKSISDWTWEEGLWTAFFKSIRKVSEIMCPHCNGTGVLHQ